jgi:N-acetylmuramoyl-L-alanine amidase
MTCFVLLLAMMLVGCGPKTKPGSDRRPITSQPTTQPAYQSPLSAARPATQPSNAISTAWPTTVEDAMKLIDARAEWTDLPPINVPRHPAEKYLRDWIIVIDPGHGGTNAGDTATRPSNRGPTGVKEAHMNLRVSLLLRRLLADAGAIVVLTRDADASLSLAERAAVANNIRRPDGKQGADLFISIHHNTGGAKSNYSSIWYHGTADNNEVELDLAKYIGNAMGAAIRTDVGKTSTIFSSHLMYPNGFGVLRACHVPAILCECSFYSKPDEEQRLRDAGYNLREAYSIYRGLCEYAYGGRPTQSTPVATAESSNVKLTTTLDEGLPPWWGSDRPRILSSTVDVHVNGQRVPCAFDPQTKQLTATFPLASEGATIEVHHQNMFKHSNWPQSYSVKRAAGSEKITVEQLPPVRDTYRAPATKPAATAAQ